MELNYHVVDSAKDKLFDEMDKIPYNEYGLVLGTSKDGKYGMNLYFKYRLDAAIDLYNGNKIDKIIVSGDNHTKTYNEPQDMTDYLILNGIPEKDIIQDYAGFRTLDSVVRSRLVFGCSNVTIISQKFHNERALFIANHFEIDAIGYNAKDTQTRANLTHVREYFARYWMYIDLFLINTQPKFL